VFKYPTITEPTPEPIVLHKTVSELKEAVEILTGQRGPVEESLEARLARIERDIAFIVARIAALENP
jgi:hypothetical protein